MAGKLFSTHAVNGAFSQAIGADPYAAIVDKLCVTTSSSAIGEDYTFALLPPKPQERWSQTILDPITGKQIRITNKRWESAVVYREEDLERDETGEISRQTAKLAQVFAAHKFRLITDLLNAGEAATISTAYDGQFFFDTDHALGSSGTVNNDVAAAQISALNVASTASVTPEEAADIMVGMASYMGGFLGSNGEPLNEMERSFVLIANNAHAGFRTAANANNLASGETNPVRAFQGDGYTIDVVLTPRITSTSKVYLLAAGSEVHKPFIMQVEKDLDIKTLGPESDFAFQNNAYAAKASWRGNAGYGEYAKAILGTLS